MAIWDREKLMLLACSTSVLQSRRELLLTLCFFLFLPPRFVRSVPLVSVFLPLLGNALDYDLAIISRW